MSVKPARRLAIAQRRQKVAKLYLQGRGQVEIAHELGITQATISKDLERIHIAWRESSIRDFDAQRELEIQRLNQIEREAWLAWERSQQPAQSAVVDGEAGSQRSRRTVKHQYGNPRFLDLALRCNEERRKILGLDAPQKLESTPQAGPVLTVEQRRTHILAILSDQFGSQAILHLQELVNDGCDQGKAGAGEPDGRRTLEAQPLGDDQEPIPASTAG